MSSYPLSKKRKRCKPSTQERSFLIKKIALVVAQNNTPVATKGKSVLEIVMEHAKKIELELYVEAEKSPTFRSDYKIWAGNEDKLLESRVELYFLKLKQKKVEETKVLSFWDDFNGMFKKIFRSEGPNDQSLTEMIQIGKQASHHIQHEAVVFVVQSGCISIEKGVVWENDYVKRIFGYSVSNFFSKIPGNFFPLLKAGMIALRTATRSYGGSARSKPLIFQTSFCDENSNNIVVNCVITTHKTKHGDLFFVVRSWPKDALDEGFEVTPNATASTVDIRREVSCGSKVDEFEKNVARPNKRGRDELVGFCEDIGDTDFLWETLVQEVGQPQDDPDDFFNNLFLGEIPL